MVFEIRLLTLNLQVFTYVTLNKFLNLSGFLRLHWTVVQIKIVDVCEAFNIVSGPMISAH